MAVLPQLQNLGKGVTFKKAGTLSDGTKILSPKPTIVKAGDHVTKSDGTNLAPGTYTSEAFKTIYNPLGNFTVGNDGLVHNVNVKIESKVEPSVAEIAPVEADTKVKPEDLTIKPIEIAEKPEKPAETAPEAKEDPKPDAEVVAVIEPVVVPEVTPTA